MLFEKMAFQFISVNQRYPLKKCADNKVVRFSLSNFIFLNQLVKEHQNTPCNILQGRLDNNLTVRRQSGSEKYGSRK
jgi:hypothetical protein